MKVLIKWNKLSIFKVIGAITLIQTVTFQPITHQPLETIRTCHMEVEYSRVQDQCKTISIIMLHKVSRDNSIRSVIEQIIQAREGPSLLRIRC